MTVFAAAGVALWLTSCGPQPEPRYPSYDAIVTQYIPLDAYEGARLEDQSSYPDSPYCHCPRVWYHDHWVYYYHGHWIYWHHGYWYHYPVFYVYYWDGVPYVYSGPHRSIVKGAAAGADGPPATASHDAPAVRGAGRTSTRSRSTSTRSTGRRQPPPARQSSSSSSRSDQERKRR